MVPTKNCHDSLCSQSLCGWPRSRSIPWPLSGCPKKSRPSHGAKVAAGGPWGGSHCRRSVLPSVSAAPGIHGPRSQCGDAGHALLPVALATGCVAGGQEDAEYHGTQVRWVLIFSGPLCFWINGITFIFEASSYPTFLMITPRIGVRPMGKLT